MVSSVTSQTARGSVCVGGDLLFFFSAEKLSENQSKDKGSCFVPSQSQGGSCNGPWPSGLGQTSRGRAPLAGEVISLASAVYCPFLSMTSHSIVRPPTSFSELHRTIQTLTRCPCLHSRLLRSAGSSQSVYQAVESCRKHFNPSCWVYNREGRRGALRKNKWLICSLHL